MTRRTVLKAALAAGTLPLWRLAHAAYPERPIRLIVPYPPGGGTDIIARLLGRSLQSQWNAEVIIDNRPGADSQIGTALVAKAPPDGYTFGVVSLTFSMQKGLYPKLPYDTVRDFVPVAGLMRTPIFVVVPANSPYTSFNALLAASKARELNYSTSSSSTLIFGNMLRSATGLRAKDIPYKGSAASVTAVAAGEVDFTLDGLLASRPLIQAGKVKFLAVMTRERSGQAPDVPTLAEQAVQGIDQWGWFGLLAPAGTPRDVVQRMNEAVRKALEAPDIRKALADLASEPMLTTQAEFEAMMKAETDRYERVVRQYGIKVD